MYVTLHPLVLASQSPRRQLFLKEAGLEFSVHAAEIDETSTVDEKPEDYVLRMAKEKAEAVQKVHGHAWVLGADTIVVYDSEILGKPRNKKDAAAMLQRLSGQKHEVMTAYCLLKERACITRVGRSKVTFGLLSAELIEAYIATGEPFDKAGAYGIQGLGGMLVTAIEGSYSNVVGMPMFELLETLQNYQIIGVRQTLLL